MKAAIRLGYSLVGALAIMNLCPSPATAQDHGSHAAVGQQRNETPDQRRQANALVRAVRESTEKFTDVEAAQGAGYALLFGCVSGGDYGAMGLHFVNLPLVGDGLVDVTKPEIVLYEPGPDGRLRITGADFLVYAADWDKTHTGAPELNGQFFHYFEAPNRFGLPAFYTLHVWAWKDNPNGTFTNWNPSVSCDGFNPPTQ